jgi:hypothetical protein
MSVIPPVPVPPFTNSAEAETFHSTLQSYLIELKVPGEPVGVHQLLLNAVIGLHRPDARTGGCTECGPPYPCRTVLSVARNSRLPIPWTLDRLLPVLAAAGLVGFDPGRPDLVVVSGGDPHVAYARDADGVWSLGFSERGNLEVTAVGDDAALCEVLGRGSIRAVGYPFGWQQDEKGRRAGLPGALPLKADWKAATALPFIDEYRPHGVL